MEVLIEEIAIYGIVFALCALTIYAYLRKNKKKSVITEKVSTTEGIGFMYAAFAFAIFGLQYRLLSSEKNSEFFLWQTLTNVLSACKVSS